MQFLTRRALLAAFALLPLAVLAHGPATREALLTVADARLLVADAANGDIVVVDLPQQAITARISTPPYVMSMGLTADQRQLYVLRGRNTDRDRLSVLHTGARVHDGLLRPAWFARSLPAASPSGVRDGLITQVGGDPGVFMEGWAELHRYRSDNFGDPGALERTIYKLAAPDHYHYLEAGAHLYVGHLRRGLVQVLERDGGAEIARVRPCPGLHGMARDDARHRLVFACRGDVIVVGTRGDEAQQIVARIPYPRDQRAAAFLRAGGNVLWGYTEGTLPLLYRLDLNRRNYVFDVLPVASSIQQATSADGRYLLVLTRAGELEIRDGRSGELQRAVRVSEPVDKDFHEHVDKAVLPDIATLGDAAYVSLPRQGRIARVNLARGELAGYIVTGGEPTRVRAVTARSDDNPAVSGRWYDREQVARGGEVYAAHCASCHGTRAAGAPGWDPDQRGTALAPPLNSTGHDTMHRLGELVGRINEGSRLGRHGGTVLMPGFEDVLSEADRVAVVAWFQDLWPDAAYRKWRALDAGVMTGGGHEGHH